MSFAIAHLERMPAPRPASTADLIASVESNSIATRRVVFLIPWRSRGEFNDAPGSGTPLPQQEWYRSKFSGVDDLPFGPFMGCRNYQYEFVVQEWFRLNLPASGRTLNEPQLHLLRLDCFDHVLRIAADERRMDAWVALTELAQNPGQNVLRDRRRSPEAQEARIGAGECADLVLGFNQ